MKWDPQRARLAGMAVLAPQERAFRHPSALPTCSSRALWSSSRLPRIQNNHYQGATTVNCLVIISSFLSKGIQKQTFSAVYRPVFILYFRDGEGFPRDPEKLIVSPASLLDAEEDSGRRGQRQQVLQSLHQQRKGGFEIHAISGKNDVGLEIDNFF